MSTHKKSSKGQTGSSSQQSLRPANQVQFFFQVQDVRDTSDGKDRFTPSGRRNKLAAGTMRYYRWLNWSVGLITQQDWPSCQHIFQDHYHYRTVTCLPCPNWNGMVMTPDDATRSDVSAGDWGWLPVGFNVNDLNGTRFVDLNMGAMPLDAVPNGCAASWLDLIHPSQRDGGDEQRQPWAMGLIGRLPAIIASAAMASPANMLDNIFPQCFSARWLSHNYGRTTGHGYVVRVYCCPTPLGSPGSTIAELRALSEGSYGAVLRQ